MDNKRKHPIGEQVFGKDIPHHLITDNINQGRGLKTRRRGSITPIHDYLLGECRKYHLRDKVKLMNWIALEKNTDVSYRYKTFKEDDMFYVRRIK